MLHGVISISARAQSQTCPACLVALARTGRFPSCIKPGKRLLLTTPLVSERAVFPSRGLGAVCNNHLSLEMIWISRVSEELWNTHHVLLKNMSISFLCHKPLCQNLPNERHVHVRTIWSYRAMLEKSQNWKWHLCRLGLQMIKCQKSMQKTLAFSDSLFRLDLLFSSSWF